MYRFITRFATYSITCSAGCFIKTKCIALLHVLLLIPLRVLRALSHICLCCFTPLDGLLLCKTIKRLSLIRHAISYAVFYNKKNNAF